MADYAPLFIVARNIHDQRDILQIVTRTLLQIKLQQHPDLPVAEPIGTPFSMSDHDQLAVPTSSRSIGRLPLARSRRRSTDAQRHQSTLVRLLPS